MAVPTPVAVADPGPERFVDHPVPWISLLGVRVSAVNLETAVDLLLEAVHGRERGYVCIRDVHGIVRSQDDARLREIHNSAFLVTPDGMPLVWALRLSGHASSDRVYGPDLMLAVLDRGRASGVRHFLYGARPETLARLESRLLSRFPGAEIVGSFSPPFRNLTRQEKQDVADMINASGADMVWVGLGTPKQEFWMADMRQRLDAPILVGVGAAFDFHAGLVRQAPRVIQRSGFEWLFRLICEPRRLWRRYATAVPRFTGLVLLQLLGLGRFSIHPHDRK